MENAITEALEYALMEAKPEPRDAAAVALLRTYAKLMDDVSTTADEARVVGDLGPKFTATLTALGMTLAGRQAKGKGGDSGDAGTGATNPLAALRGQFAATVRANGSPNLHAKAA